MEQQATSEATQAWQQLRRTELALSRYIDQHLSPLGLTAPLALALDSIARGQGHLTPTDLARELSQQTQSVTGLLDRLEQRGWVQRVRDLPDRRQTRLVVTDAGTAMLAEVRPVEAACLAKVFRTIAPAELTHLVEVLGRVHESAT